MKTYLILAQVILCFTSLVCFDMEDNGYDSLNNKVAFEWYKTYVLSRKIAVKFSFFYILILLKIILLFLIRS